MHSTSDMPIPLYFDIETNVSRSVLDTFVNHWLRELAGTTYRAASGLVLDLHGTFRLNANPGLVLERPGSKDYASMHTWEASAALGYEF